MHNLPIQARPATQKEILELPNDLYFDRPGHIRKTFLDQIIQLHYLPGSHPLMQNAKVETQKGGCLKHSTGAVLVGGEKILGTGANAGRKMTYCKRVQKKCSTGEGYEYCRDPETCHQIEHAEVMAILDATKKLNETKGQQLLQHIQQVNETVHQNGNLKKAYEERNQFIKSEIAPLFGGYKNLHLGLYGHWWCCQSCMSAMIEAGIKKIYLAEDANALFDSRSSENILPKLDEITAPRE